MTPAVTYELATALQELVASRLNPLELISRHSLVEKLVELQLLGTPPGPEKVIHPLAQLVTLVEGMDVSRIKVVVFGGGTGLSTIIGGDSNQQDWPGNPFQGLKTLFPETRAVVCVTDDGGSTGELLKDLPLIGLGDIRHVLLSSIRKQNLLEQYGLSEPDCLAVTGSLFLLFNSRLSPLPDSLDGLLDLLDLDLGEFPASLGHGLRELLARLYTDKRLAPTLKRSHCLGNLLLASAIYLHVPQDDKAPGAEAIRHGINYVGHLLGAGKDSVLPCTTTASKLKVMYANGVLVTGEHKSAIARRDYPVEQVFVEFSGPPRVLPQVVDAIEQADIILFAPGSLYTSVVPVLQVPGLSEAVRRNTKALKVLVANLWAQAGETDIARDDPGRRYYVSDLIQAYHRNIPGGVADLFHVAMVLGLQDIPGSIIQRYAIEGKTPIYLDRDNVWQMGVSPLEGTICSMHGLNRQTVKHDPASFATALKTLWCSREFLENSKDSSCFVWTEGRRPVCVDNSEIPCQRFQQISERLAELEMPASGQVSDILWHHWDIPVSHLQFIRGMRFVDQESWRRCQEWDNVFSFYDPDDGLIKIRKDVSPGSGGFQTAFLIALGQSLLGNYASHKSLTPLIQDGEELGRVYRVRVRRPEEYCSFFTGEEMEEYLMLARMQKSQTDLSVFTRLLNANEGFTPPGLLFGLTYAWYLDNKLASHIEYKMSISRTALSDLVPEQVKTLMRRTSLVSFFRRKVFRQDLGAYERAIPEVSLS